MKKRALTALLALAFLLAACGRQPQETQAATVTPPPQTRPSEPSLPETHASEPEPEDFVRVLDYVPSARQQLMYATDQNFTGQRIYDLTDAYLS